MTIANIILIMWENERKRELEKEREREKADIRATCYVMLICMNKLFAISTERDR